MRFTGPNTEQFPQSSEHNEHFLEEDNAILRQSEKQIPDESPQPAIIFLRWAVLPARLYLQLYYLAHVLILTTLLPLTIYTGLALMERGKHKLSILAIGNSVSIVALIALMYHWNEKLMEPIY